MRVCGSQANFRELSPFTAHTMDEEDVTMEEPAPEVAADASEKAPAAPDTSGRAAIVADFIRNAPPGGRDEVYNGANA